MDSDREMEKEAIVAAIRRLIDGEPIRSSGKLTVEVLAEESEVPRGRLYRHHEELLREYRAKAASDAGEPALVVRLRAEIAELSAGRAALKNEVREQKRALEKLAEWNQILTLENEEHKKSEAGKVSPITRMRLSSDHER